MSSYNNSSSWSGKVSSLNQTGHGNAEGSNRININSPILQQATSLPITVSQQHNYLSGYLNLNQGYQDRYSTNVSPFVSTSSNELNQMILSSASIVQPAVTDDNKLVTTQLKVPIGASSTENTSGALVESSRKICTDFTTQNLPNNHLNIQQQHGTCYDYNAIGTRFALLLESLKSSMAKNAPTHLLENPKSLTDTIHLYQQHQAPVNNVQQNQGISVSSNNNNSDTEYLKHHQMADNLQQLASLHSGQQSGNLSRYISPDDNYQFANIEHGLNKARLSQNYTTFKVNNQIFNSTASNSSTSSSPRD